MPATTFAFAFLGAYFYILQMLVRRYFQNDLDGDRWVRIRRTPRMTDGVEDYAATNEQILVRTEGESGGLAEVHRKQRRLHRATTLRVDSYDRAFVEPADAGRCRGSVVAAGAVHFRDGHVEFASARIPHRLFRAIGRLDAVGRVERDSWTDRQVSVLLVDRDEGGKGWVVGVVHREEDPISRVVSQFIGPQAIGSAGVDIADDLVCCEVDGYHPAVGVGDKQPASVRGNHDAVGTGSVVAPREPLERLRPGGFDLPDEEIPLGVDDFDGSIGAIGQIVELGARVDPADIKDD